MHTSKNKQKPKVLAQEETARTQ